MDEVLTWRQAGGAQLSPDGRQVLFRISEADPLTDGSKSATWLMNARGGEARKLADVPGARWSPDGLAIAFTQSVNGRSQIFIRGLGAADAPRRITDGALSPSQLAWSPDGRTIAFFGQVPRAPTAAPKLPGRPAGARWSEDALVVDDLHYRGITGGARSTWRHLFVVSVADGVVRQLTSGAWDVGARYAGMGQGATPRWSPNGKSILIDGLTRPEALADWRFSDILSVPIDGGPVQVLSGGPGFWTGPAPSPDGRWVAYSGYEDDAASWPRRDLYVVGRDGQRRVVRRDLPDDPSFLDWTPDGRAILYGVNHAGRTELRRLALDGRETVIVGGDFRFYAAAAAAWKVAGTLESPTTPGEIAVVDLRSGRLQRLTEVSKDRLKDIDLAKTEAFTYRAADGTALEGWLVTPPGFDPSRKYPMVLDIHGGPHSLYGWGFDARYQDLAAQGYVVAYVNPRGSTGYGAAFANAIDQIFPGDVDAGDLLAGADAVLARGFVDPARQYVMGCSGGGALSAWLTSRTDRFKAAVVMCPVTDWISLAATTDVTAWGMNRFARPFWEDPAPWLAHSPLLQVGRVNTPTLVMVGDKDFRTPAGQSESYYAALKSRGVPARLVVIRGETHQPWKGAPSNFMRVQLFIRDWFARFGGVPVTAP